MKIPRSSLLLAVPLLLAAAAATPLVQDLTTIPPSEAEIHARISEDRKSTRLNSSH